MTTEAKPGPDGPLKPTAIMRNVYGLFPPLALLAGMKLDVFTPLREGPLAAPALAAALGVREDMLTPLLYALVAAGLLAVEGEAFANTEEAAAFLVRGRPEYLGGLSGFYTMLLEIVLKTADTVGAGAPQAKLDFHAWSDEDLAAYFRRQIPSGLRGGREIAEKIDFSGFATILDAGGGSGGVSIALCGRYPRLRATVVDLPKVAALAEGFIAEAGLSGRIDVSPTDLCLGPPAGAYDAAVLRAFIQTLSRDDARKALQNIGHALSPGGRIFIVGNVLENSRLGPPSSIAFSLVFLNTYDHGRAYTEDEYRGMLDSTGFTDFSVDYEALDGACLIRARKR